MADALALVAGACRAEGRRVAAATGAGAAGIIVAAAAARTGGTPPVGAVASARRRDSAAPPATAGPPGLAALLGWLGGSGAPAMADGGGSVPDDALPLALLVAGLLAAALLAARAIHVPAAGRAGRDHWRSVLDRTRAAGGELGEALPLLLIVLLAGTLIVLWILTP